MALNYLTLSEFKSRLGISGSSQDATLTAILTGVEAQTRVYLNFDPSISSLTEYYDSFNSYYISLHRWPVTSVTSVYLDQRGFYGESPDGFPAETLLTQGVDYLVSIDQGVRSGVLVRVGQPWLYNLQRIGGVDLTALPSPCPGAIKCSYVVDTTDVLAVATQAGYLESTAQYRSILLGAGILTSDSLDGASVTVSLFQPNKDRKDQADSFVSAMTAKMLNPFRIGRFV